MEQANESELQKEQVTAQQDLHWIVCVSVCVTEMGVKYKAAGTGQAGQAKAGPLFLDSP